MACGFKRMSYNNVATLLKMEFIMTVLRTIDISQGIIIPKALVEQAELDEHEHELELKLTPDGQYIMENSINRKAKKLNKIQQQIADLNAQEPWK